MLLGLLRTVQRNSVDLPSTRIAHFELLHIFALCKTSIGHYTRCASTGLVCGKIQESEDRLTHGVPGPNSVISFIFCR